MNERHVLWGRGAHFVLYTILQYYYLQQNENLQTVKQICILALARSGLTQQLAEFLQATNCEKNWNLFVHTLSHSTLIGCF